ncbi:MAG: HEAT repeat domain-containing protein [Planctomycetaceae bacterium]|nr:HEAT repeat domain-containing protein [Planctomycetaceae bacterium]
METAPGPLPFSTPGAEIPSAQPERISSTTMQLWKQLVHPESENAGWESTFEALVSLDHDAVPLLKIKLRTGDPLEREMASTVLAQLGPIADGAAEELTRALADPSVYVRANVAATLVQLPGSADRAVPVLIQLLGSSEPELRQLAVTNLTMAGSAVTPYSAELLAAVTRLTDQDSRVQVLSILQSLRENGGEPTRVLESADSFQLTGGSANSDGESEPEISGF